MKSKAAAEGPQKTGTEQSVQRPWGLYATVAGSGAAVMAIEVLGTRLLGPVFGVGLFVWAALLSVTLCSLAIGYYAGGAWADRVPTPRPLGTVLLVAAVTLAVVVPLSRSILSLALDLGHRLGPLVAGTALFTLPLALLGAVGPMVIRITTRDVRLTGHSAGSVYAISTAGSLFGTLLVSFWAIPSFETTTIFVWTAGLLALLGAFWLAGAARGFALILAASLPVTGSNHDDRLLPTHLEVVARVHSPYSLLEVIDDEKRQVRFLRADHSIIGGMFKQDGDVIFNYLRVLNATPSLRPTANKALQIGMGTGALAGLLHAQGVEVDIVEIDPGVVQLATDYFGFKASGQVVVEDARTFLSHAKPGYDIIIHDTFTGGATPAHLLSVEVVQQIKRLLRPDGLLALSFVGFAEGDDVEIMNAVYSTVRAVFPNTRLFRDSARASAEPTLVNLLLFASTGEIDLTAASGMSELARNLLGTGELTPTTKVPAITDAHNPLSQLQLPVAEAHFQAMEKLLPRAVWLP